MSEALGTISENGLDESGLGTFARPRYLGTVRRKRWKPISCT